MAKSKQFRYLVSNALGFINTETTIDIFTYKYRSESRDAVPQWMERCKKELEENLKLKKKADKFIQSVDVVNISVTHYTTHQHNNGYDDTVVEVVTVLYNE